jgi:hypothetical protein
MNSKPVHLYSDGFAPVFRSSSREVFFIRLEAAPQVGSDDFGDLGGAYVNCYLNADDLRTAELQAIALIQNEGWQPVRFETWRLVCIECESNTDNDYEESPTPRELIEEAVREGGACLFHSWPIDAPDNQP